MSYQSKTYPPKKSRRFEDLIVWQKSRELTKEIYQVSATWRDQGLQDQLRRASVSVISNIAEGFERGSKDEFLYFLYVARGSAGEVRSQLYVACDVGYITGSEFDRLNDLADHCSRLLVKFINGLKLKSTSGQKFSDPRAREQREFLEQVKSSVPKQYRIDR